MYNIDPKKTMQLLTKDQAPQCEVEHESLKNFSMTTGKKENQLTKN
jgi:hypothetical protein